MSEYQVGRSDEVGSRGLYTLVKNVKDRPHSLIIPPGLLSFASGPKSPKSPKSGLTPKSIFAMVRASCLHCISSMLTGNPYS